MKLKAAKIRHHFSDDPRTWLSLLLLAIITLSPATAGQSQTELPALTSKLGGASEKADFIFVIDRSGSMNRFWDSVKSGIADFVAAVPQGDYISIISFDSAAGELITPREITSSNRQSISDQIRGLPKPDGKYTDLGAGIDRTLDELNRPHPGRLQFVFFFTDFKHEPPAGSHYSPDTCAAQAWQSLSQKKTRILEATGCIAKVYALRLPIDSEVGRDIGLFQCVLGNIEQVSVDDGNALTAWFERKKLEIARDKLRAQIEDEIRRGIDISLAESDKEARVPLTITSRCRNLDIRVDGIEVSGRDDSGASLVVPPDSGSFVLAPGQKREIRLALTPAQKRQSLRLLSCSSDQVAVDASASATLLPLDEIAILMQPSARYSMKGTASVSHCSGISAWLAALCLVMIVATAGAIYLRWGKPEKMTGTVVVQNGPSTMRHDVFGQEVIFIGNTDECRNHGFYSDSFDGGTPIEIQFRARKPRLFRSRPERGIYVTILKGTGRMKVQQFDEKANRFKAVFIGIPRAFSLMDRPIDPGTEIEAGGCSIKWK